MADAKGKGGPKGGSSGGESADFLGLIIIIVFVAVFLGAFSGGTKVNTPASTVQDQNQVQQNTETYSNASVQYQGQTVINQPAVQYSNSNPTYGTTQGTVPVNQSNCGSIGGAWNSNGTCSIWNISQAQCNTLSGVYQPVSSPSCLPNQPCPQNISAPFCTIYWIQYSNSTGPVHGTVPANQNNCGSVGGMWNSNGTCQIGSISQSQCTALGGAYQPSQTIPCTVENGGTCYSVTYQPSECTIYSIQQ